MYFKKHGRKTPDRIERDTRKSALKQLERRKLELSKCHIK